MSLHTMPPASGSKLALFGALLLTVATSQPAFSHEKTAHEMQASSGYSSRVQEVELPDVALTDQHGNDVRLRELLGEDTPVVLNFIYTTCATVCPVLSAGFADIQDTIGSGTDRPRMVSITIDPEHDTPEKLRDYATRFRAGDDWVLLTGALDEVVTVQKAFDAYRQDKMSHVPLTYLRRPETASWLRLEGFPGKQDLIEQYRGLATDANEEGETS